MKNNSEQSLFNADCFYDQFLDVIYNCGTVVFLYFNFFNT